MIIMPDRYIINTTGPDEGAIILAFLKTTELCGEFEYNSVILYIPGLGNLRGAIGNVLGNNVIKRLSKDKRVIYNQMEITLKTERIEILEWTEDIVLSIYPTKRMFDSINDLNRARAIVVVPWNEREKEEWIRTWNPEVVGGEEAEVEPLELNAAVESALNTLTSMVNLSTGLTHSSDKESAITLLRILHNNQVPLDPNNMRIWALRNGWTSEGANDLQEIAQGVLEGKRYKTSGRKIWNDEFINGLLGR